MRARLLVEADTVGDEELRQMAGELDRIGGEGAQAAAQLNALAGGLDAIAGEGAQAKKEVQDLGPAWKQAGDQAEASGAKQLTSHRKISAAAQSISRELAVIRNAYISLQAAMGAVQAAKSLTDTADQVANLQARIKLVTGDGQLFGQMWDQVTQTAMRTNSELEATGGLFARVAKAGMEAGLSAQAAAEQSLQITEAINQATQLSGASAEASSAAITQLIQGLQAGVLRGDEFNSVMEQAPRLAQALADGLGVATGQLRGMAQAGELTADKVIGALKSQSEALQQEFGTLPQTVGRSVENLATSWSLFISETDKTTGASQKVASAIDLLAKNLDTVATVALRAGEVIAAMLAIKTIQSVYSYGSALLSAASATTTLATASTQAAGAISAAAAAKARFASVARGIGYAVIADQVLQIALAYKGIREEQEKQAKSQANIDSTNAKIAQRLREISDATGVAVGSMQDLDESVGAGLLVFNEALGKWQSATQLQRELAQAVQLTAAEMARADASKIVAEFDALSAKSGKAEEALKKLGDSLKFSDVQGAASFALALDDLRAKGELAAQQVGDSWQRALDKLNAGQLGALRANLEDASRQGVLSAEQWAQANEQVLAASFGRLGVNAAQAMGTISDSSRQAIDLLQQRLDAAGQAGQMGAQGVARVTEALERQRQVIEGQVPGIQRMEEALRALGVTPQKELDAAARTAREAFTAIRDSGAATASELDQAWRAMAQAQIAANGGVADAALKAQASQRGFVIEADAAGQAIVKSMGEAAQATQGVGQAAQEAGEKARAAQQSMALGAKEVEDAMVNAIQRHADSGNQIQLMWLDAATAASRYRDEAAAHAQALEGNWQSLQGDMVMGWGDYFRAWNTHFATLRKLAEEYAASLERVDAQQQALDRANSGAAKGVDDLRMRLLELSGTEEQIAKARSEREKAEVQRQIKLAELEATRARIRGDSAAAQAAAQDIADLREQLKLLNKIHAAEERNRKKKEREESSSSGGSSGGSSSAGGSTGGGGGNSAGGRSGGTLNITLNANGINDPVRLAKMIEPELAKMQRLAR